MDTDSVAIPAELGFTGSSRLGAPVAEHAGRHLERVLLELGVKASGFGRFGGRAALEELTELSWISLQQTPRQYAIE
jgi:acyl-CoA reductase-like NAD-dependent aldehyde dehydrogenase